MFLINETTTLYIQGKTIEWKKSHYVIYNDSDLLLSEIDNNIVWKGQQEELNMRLKTTLQYLVCAYCDYYQL